MAGQRKPRKDFLSRIRKKDFTAATMASKEISTTTGRTSGQVCQCKVRKTVRLTQATRMAERRKIKRPCNEVFITVDFAPLGLLKAIQIRSVWSWPA